MLSIAWAIVLLLVIGIPLVAVIIGFWRREVFGGGRLGALTIACVLLWASANIVEYASTGYDARLLWSKLALIALTPTSLLWLLTALQLSGNAHLIRARWLVPSSALIIASIVIGFTNEYHHLFWSRVYLDADGYLITRPGPWNTGYMLLAYTYSLIGVGLIVANILRVSRTRASLILLAFGVVVPKVANSMYVLHISPFKQVDPTSFALCLTCLLYGASILRFRMLPSLVRFMPGARDSIVTSMLDGVLVVDSRGRVLDANPAAETLLEQSQQTLRRRPLTSVHPALGELGSHQPTAINLDLRLADGATRSLAVVARPLRQLGQSVGHLLVLRDITEQRRMERALRDSEQRYRHVVNSVHEVIFQIDVHGCWQLLNPAWTVITGHSLSKCIGEPVMGFIHPEDQEAVREATLPMISGDTAECRLQVRIMRHDDTARYVEVTARAVYDAEGTRIGISGTLIDITERRALEKQLIHQAFHDGLTGLANRFQFHERVSHALARVRRGRRDPLHAVLFLDLDNFKKVNDSLGHDTGDQLLVEVGNRLRRTTRSGDTVARLGGDEFAILLEDLPDARTAEHVAGEIVRRLEAPIRIGAHNVFAGASVGVALSTGVTDASTILRHADIAMYAAKHGGRGRVERFTAGMDAQVRERVSLEEDMHRALQRNEFFLVYQPTVDLRSGEVIGTEALLRWQHPERGLVPPAVFIPIAEESGLILDIGRWVCREACRQTREWQRLHPSHGTPLRIAVNLSARQFASIDLVAMVHEALTEAGLDPNDLTLELTESVVMQNTEATIERLDALKQLGVRLAVDDFGTGYSSLSYLQRFPIDVLKIDKTFVSGAGRGYGASADVGEGDGDGTFARTIVQLSSALQLATVAEGIETREQALHLLEAGCPLGQGYFYAQPLTAAAITDTLLKQGLATWQLPLGASLAPLPATAEQQPIVPEANAAA